MKTKKEKKIIKDNNTMKDQKSSFDLLRGSGNFSNEPYWYKLIVIAIHFLFLLTLAAIIKEWALGIIITKYASRIHLLDLFKGLKGRSP